MGMACDADARGTVASGGSSLTANGTSASARAFVMPGAGSKLSVLNESGGDSYRAPPTAAAAGMNAEETALILASLSKGQFGPVAFASEDSDLDDSKHHSDMEDISGDEHDDDYNEHDDDNDDGSGGNGPGSRVHRVQQINFDGPVGSKLDFLDDAGFSHRFRNESNRVKSLVTKHISIDELRAHFDRPIIDVAKDFGICITLMKKICRRNGIKRWPHRQIRSLSKSIASMEAAMLSAHGGERDKYRDQISNLKMKRESVIADPNKESAMRPKTPPAKDAGMARTVATMNAVPHGAKLSSMHASQLPQPFTGSPSASGSVEIKSEPMSIGYASGHTVNTVNTVGSTSGSMATAASATGGAHAKGGRWTSEEHAAFLEGIRLYGKDWRRVAQVVVTRSAVQTRTHAQKYLLKFAGRFPFEGAGSGGAVDSGSTTFKDVPAVAMGGDGGSGSHSVAAADEDAAMASPHSSHSVLAPGRYENANSATDDQENRMAWRRHEDALARSASRVAVEAMAMILNSPESVSSQTTASSSSPSPVLQLPTAAAVSVPSSSHADDARGRDALMYSPMSATSSFGRALPSLAIPAIKSEASMTKQRGDSPVGDDECDGAAMAP